jgi:hypothetical protein
MPNNVGLDGLGFVKDAYRRITHLSHLDFRVGSAFHGTRRLVCSPSHQGAVSTSKAETPSPETVFDGMELQRLRLHHDQQVPEGTRKRDRSNLEAPNVRVEAPSIVSGRDGLRAVPFFSVFSFLWGWV